MLFSAHCNPVDTSSVEPLAKDTVKPVPTQMAMPAPIISEDQYAFIRQIGVSGNEGYVDADFVQFLDGEAAVMAARKDGEADVFVDENGDTSYAVANDYYIVNESKKLRRLYLSSEIAFEFVMNPDGSPPVTDNSFQTFRKIYHDRIFILTIEGDKIKKVTEVFIP